MSKPILETCLHNYVVRMKRSCGIDYRDEDATLISEACIFYTAMNYDRSQGTFNGVIEPKETVYEWPKSEGSYNYFLEIFPTAMIEKECARYRSKST
jgi:hypothetical protein